MGHTFYKVFLLTACIGLCWANNVHSQDKNKPLFPTQNTSINPKLDPKEFHKETKPIRYIITNDTKSTLSGNRCFEDVTIEMGFQYLAMPKGQTPNKNGWSRWWHNFGVKSVILWKNGPFWKSKINRKYEECKYGSGDYTG